MHSQPPVSALTTEALAHRIVLGLREAQKIAEQRTGNPVRPPARERETEPGALSEQSLRALLLRVEQEARELERRLVQGQADPATPLTTAEFNALLEAVRRAPNLADEVQVVRVAAYAGWFTCEQLRVLIRRMGSVSNEEAAAVLVYPRLVDAVRFFTLADAFNRASSFHTVCARVGIK